VRASTTGTSSTRLSRGSAQVQSGGFRVQSGFGFRVSGFGFRVSGFGFQVYKSGFGFPKALASNYAETPSARLHNWNVLDLLLARLGAGTPEAHRLCVSLNARLESNEEEEGLPEIRLQASGVGD